MKKLRQWLRDFFGISEIITRIHNMEGDVNCLMAKQLDEVDPLPVDAPECGKNSPYQYILTGDEKYGWYALWNLGFAGPFEKEEQAYQYIEDNELETYKPEVHRLCPLPFEIKK